MEDWWQAQSFFGAKQMDKLKVGTAMCDVAQIEGQ